MLRFDTWSLASVNYGFKIILNYGLIDEMLFGFNYFLKIEIALFKKLIFIIQYHRYHYLRK